MTTFGASGKGPDLFRHFGFTAAAVVETAQSLLSNGE
jgi:transketolase